MPNASLADLPSQVALALSLASNSTGTDYHYLLSTARSESSFQTEAKAPTSSAQGLFQFIEETWIRTVKDEGGQFGLGTYAARITKTSTGRYIIANPADRAAILALRKDPKISAMMAGAYARRNAEFVQGEIGRKPTSDELYIAHFLGPADASKLITLRDREPNLSAAELFPAAAKANRTIFYSDSGPRDVAQVYDLLVSRQQDAPSPPQNNGAFFRGNIDFGSWSPTVEKIFESKPKPQFAAAEGMSLFDFLAGKTAAKNPTQTPPEADAPVPPDTAAGKGWSAEINPSEHRIIPYITVADDADDPNQPQDGPLSALSRKLGEAPAVATNAEPAPAHVVRVAEAAGAVSDAPRLKIIHVPPK